MPSPDRLAAREASLDTLLRKDARELIASRALWLLLLVVGLLVGHEFLTATQAYAEMSGSGGGPAILAQGLSPLDGLIVPTFAAYDIAATFLLPFVVIRLVATERQTGALRLVLQARAGHGRLMLSKVVVLLCAWLMAMIPGAIALLMWRLAGGHLSGAEALVVVLGHMILAGITVSVAAAAAGIARSAASAAIVALTFTLGTWALDFAAAVRGDALQEIARYTPTAVVRTFEHGELRVATIVVALIVMAAGLALATISLDLGATLRRRAIRSAGAVALAAIAAALAAQITTSWDLSQDRRNSLPPADEAALGAVHDRLHVEVHLAGEDPRRVDLEREVLSKVRRSMRVDIDYVEGDGTGMLSRSNHYGEMVYTIGPRSDTTRSVVQPIVLEIIYKLAGVTPPVASETSSYPGYPLSKAPSGIAVVFFVLWPLLVLGGWWWFSERRGAALS